MKTELRRSEIPRTKGKDIFDIGDKFFNKMVLEWTKLVGCTTDGVPAVLGRKLGF